MEPAKRRQRYTPRACNECQRRKVKCSGDETCTNCRARDVLCGYSGHDDTVDAADGSRPAKRARRAEQSTSPGSGVRRKFSLREDLRNENKLLREQVDNLKRDMDLLFRGREPGLRSSIAETGAGNSSSTLGHSDTDATNHSKNEMEVLFTQPKLPSHGEPSPLQDVDSLSSQGDADTFEPSSPWPNSLAICSQISSLVSTSISHPTRRSGSKLSPIKGAFTIHLPTPKRLQFQLLVFFQHFDCYFPFLNWQRLGQRLTESFSALGYRDSNTTLRVSSDHYKIMGIVCSASAMSMQFSTSTVSVEWRPGWKMYLQGKHLMQNFDECGEADVDVLTYHTISSAYLLQGEMLHSASLHIAQGSQIAFKIGLNDRNLWEDSQCDIVFRQNLWWVFYFLDKRITQKSGTPYLIRESEVAVEDFRNSNNPDEDGSLAFLQSMVTYCNLWTNIWDKFFGPNAPNAKDWEAIQIADARIVILHQRISEQLVWSTDQCEQYIVRGESAVQINRRLIVHLRHKCLRLSIRHGCLSDAAADIQRRQSCFLLVRDVLEAIAGYISLHKSYQTCGYVLTTALVECMYHLVPESRSQSSSLDRSSVRQSLDQARSLLLHLSSSVVSAFHAFQVLRGVLDEKEFSAGPIPKCDDRMPQDSKDLDFKNIFTLTDDPWDVSEAGIFQGWQENPFESLLFFQEENPRDILVPPAPASTETEIARNFDFLNNMSCIT